MVHTILLTRPSNRANSMTAKLSALGCNVVSIPCLEIEYIPQKISQLSDYQIIIFVSVNAVDGFFSEQHPQLSNSTIIMAIGEQTAARLNALGVKKVIYPVSEFDQNSESFVNLPELKNINKFKILMVRGDYSREYINRALAEKGAILDEAIVYHTKIPSHLNSSLNNYLAKIYVNEWTDLSVIVTSISILENFSCSIDNQYVPKLFTCKLIVPSARIEIRAQELGYTNIFNTNTMNEDSIIAMIT